MGFTPSQVKEALDKISKLLGVRVSPELQARYESGREMYALSYEKIQESTGLQILQRYIIAASSYLHQPCAYYDIFRACRATIYIQLLASAVEHLLGARVKGASERLKRLTEASDYDQFDSVLFELVVAWRYNVEIPDTKVAFLKETGSHRTPDFSYEIQGVDCYCECKKVSRSDSHAVRMRNAARDCLNPIITRFREEGLAVNGEVVFHADPKNVSTSKIGRALDDALRTATPIFEKDFTVTAERLAQYESDTYALYPSPAFYWRRYGYRHRSDWFGIVHQIHADFVQPNGEPLDEKVPFSTWVSDVRWDAAIKWKISDEKIVAKYRRFAFDNVFGALSQIETKPLNSTVHVWIESDYYLKGRSDTLRNLFERIQNNARDFFGWLMINETLVDVSPMGFFDIIEHSHIIEGPTALTSKPPVTLILTRHSTQVVHTGGEFGEGTELPDIDQ